MPQIYESAVTGGPLLKGSTGRIEITVYKDGTATATDNDPTTPTVTVTRADGTVLVTAQSTTKTSAGVYYYTLTPTQCSRVDTLTVALTGTWGSAAQTFTHTLEVQGPPLFTIAQARAFQSPDGTTGALNDATKYPAADLLTERNRVAALLEEWTGVSWIPRHHRESIPGQGGYILDLPHLEVQELIAASIGGVAQTVADITVERSPGWLHHTGSTWTPGTITDPLNVTVEYEHGYTGLPYGVTRIALLLTVDRLVKNPIPARALSYTDDTGGSIRLVTEGGPADNPSRIPEVNEWVRAHSRISPLY